MKVSIINRLLAVLVVVVMLFSFAACGGKTTEDQKTQSTNEQSNIQPTTAEEAFDPMAKYDPAINIKFGFTIANDFKFTSGESVDKNPWIDLYKEYGINVTTQWNTATVEDHTTKMNTAIASGDYPDIMVASSSDFINWAKNGVIADISGLYDKYINDHGKEYLNSDGGVGLKSARYNGKLYGIPSIGNPFDGAMILWLRNDWLKKLNLQAPKTVDELVKVAESFTKQDPDGNGKDDTYGLALNGKEVFLYFSGIQSFFEMYGAVPGYWDTSLTFINSGDGIKWGGEAPVMKDGLRVLQGMYKSGSIAKDFGLMDGNKVLAEVSAGKAGMYFAPMWGCMSVQNDILKNNPNADLIAVPLPGADANTPGKSFLGNSTATYWCVSSKCENPEALYKLFNLGLEKLCYTKDQSEYDNYMGTSENSYSEWKLALVNPLPPLKNYDNFKKIKAAVESKDPSQLNIEQKNNYEGIMKYLNAPKVDGSNAEYVAGWGLYKVFADPNGGYAAIDQIITNKAYTSMAFNAPPTEKMANKFPTLNKMVKESIIKIIYGEPVDNYDKLLDNWKKLGGDEVTKEANDWYAQNGK